MRGLKATSAGSLNPQLQPVMNRRHPRPVASGLPVSRGFNLDDRVVQVRLLTYSTLQQLLYC